MTVSDLVGELVGEGLVEELGAPAESRVGKPPILVGLAADSAHIVALDLSVDDTMTGAVINLAGEVKARRELALEGRKGDDAVAVVHRLAAELIGLADRPVLGVGVGSPGVVDADGTVIAAPNLGWADVPLAAGLREALGLPVFVANDANTAVLGEHTFGDTGDGGLMVIRVGTGVGAGLVLEGTPAARQPRGRRRDRPRRRRPRRRALRLLATRLPRDAAGGAAPAPAARRGRPDGQLLAAIGEQLGAVLAPVVGTLNLHELVLSGPADLLDGPLREADRPHDPGAHDAREQRGPDRAHLDPGRGRRAGRRRRPGPRRRAGRVVTTPSTTFVRTARVARQSRSGRTRGRDRTGDHTETQRGTLRCASTRHSRSP